MNQAQIFWFISNVFCFTFAQSINNHSSADNNMLLRPTFVSNKASTNDLQIAASFFIVDCQLLPNTHFVIQINEGVYAEMGAIRNKFLVNDRD